MIEFFHNKIKEKKKPNRNVTHELTTPNNAPSIVPSSKASVPGCTIWYPNVVRNKKESTIILLKAQNNQNPLIPLTRSALPVPWAAHALRYWRLTTPTRPSRRSATWGCMWAQCGARFTSAPSARPCRYSSCTGARSIVRQYAGNEGLT